MIVLAGFLPQNAIEDTLVIGELSLDGLVRHTRGVLPMAATARLNGYKRMFVPEVDAPEAALIPDIEVVPVKTLADLYDHLFGRRFIEPYQPSSEVLEPLFTPTDFSEVKGQEHVKRALEVAAAGGHNCLLIGPPGGGKTLLARALPGILPDMSIEESLDVTRIYSVADQLPAGMPLIRHRPFRAPHHTISHAGLVGGENIPKPGEISLAHRGVLFLDEFPEFGTRVLEVLRQPMEDKVVTISRAKGSLTLIDVAVPRNVEPSTANIPNVFLHNMDSLQTYLKHSVRSRQLEQPHAEKILAEELDEFCEYLRTYQILPVITALYERTENIRTSELEKSLKRMTTLNGEEQAKVEALTRAIVSKLLHVPTSHLRNSENSLAYADILNELFELNTK